MQIIKKTKEIYQAFSAIKYLILHENLRNPFKGLVTDEEKSRTLMLLANGPSLKNDLEYFSLDSVLREQCDFFVLNDFSTSNYYTLLKPKHYVMSDPLFFCDTIYSERGHKALEFLARKTTWGINLFVPMLYKGSTYLNIIKENENINIVYFHSGHYHGNKNFLFWLYSKGFGNGEFGTVVLNGIYAALAMGYKTIKLYGVDHTFFGNLVVDSNNRLCYKEEHFFGKDTSLKPMKCHYPGMPDFFTMEMFLEEKLSIFKGHEIMSEWAKKIGARVINCTECSMIDSYEREQKTRQEGGIA